MMPRAITTSVDNLQETVEQLRGCKCDLYIEPEWASHAIARHIDLYALYSEQTGTPIGVTEIFVGTTKGLVGVYAIASEKGEQFRAWVELIVAELPDGRILTPTIMSPGAAPVSSDETVDHLARMCFVIFPAVLDKNDHVTILIKKNMKDFVPAHKRN